MTHNERRISKNVSVEQISVTPVAIPKGCQPYTIVPCGKGKGVCADPDPDTPECSVKSCTNTNYSVNYKTDLHYGKWHQSKRISKTYKRDYQMQ